jgi:hypothetical protein
VPRREGLVLGSRRLIRCIDTKIHCGLSPTALRQKAAGSRLISQMHKSKIHWGFTHCPETEGRRIKADQMHIFQDLLGPVTHCPETEGRRIKADQMHESKIPLDTSTN